MNKQLYLQKKEEELKNHLDTKKRDGNILNNYFNQTVAKRYQAQNVEFSYNEEYLWKKALFLSSKAYLLLNSNLENKTAIESLKYAADIYFNLSEVSNDYDKKYCIILSALCYDMAGYQANAYALITSMRRNYYELNPQDNDILIEHENQILLLTQLILEKKLNLIVKKIIPSACEALNSDEYIDDEYKEAFNHFYNAMNKLSIFLLSGKNNDYLYYLNQSFKLFLGKNNVYISHLIDLLISRCILINKRCTWNNINVSQDIKWYRYLKLLSIDKYENEKIKNISKRVSIFEFWISQLEALNKDVLNDNKSFVIQMPTGAGKTLIAELCILNALINNPDKKCLYIAPFRALTNEVKDTLAKNLNKIGLNVSGITGGYEIEEEITNYWLNKSQIIVATPEKIDLLLRLNPEFFDNISLIVVDEGHIIGNYDSRGVLLEVLMTKLKYKLRDNNVKFLFISAVMPDINLKEFSLWLSGNDSNFIQSPHYIGNKEWEASNRFIGALVWEKNQTGTIHLPSISLKDKKHPFVPRAIIQKKYFLKKKNGEYSKTGKVSPSNDASKGEIAVELLYKYTEIGSLLVFSATKKNVKSIADKFLELIALKEEREEDFVCPEYFKINEGSESYITAKEWLGKDHTVTKCLRRGVGIHYGELNEAVRKAIERDFRNKRLIALISTNTIGQGVNFPIRTLIIHSLFITKDENDNDIMISKRDFWNIFGRAGRPGREIEGLLLWIIKSRNDNKLFNEYLNKKNVEPNYTALYQALRELFNNRLNPDALENFKIFAENYFEPAFLNIILEEIINTDDESKIEEILNHSLFHIQALDSDLDIKPIVEETKNISKRFIDNVPDPELRKVFANTGLKIQSCKILSDFIQENITSIEFDILIDNFENVFKLFHQIVYELDESYFLNTENQETRRNNILDLKENQDCLNNLIFSWINGEQVNNLRREWERIFNSPDLKDNFLSFIENALNFRYPWLLSAYIQLICFHLKQNYNELSDNFKNLPSFVKYGVNNNCAVWLHSLGINSRKSTLILSDIATIKYSVQTYNELIQCLQEICSTNIIDSIDDLNKYEKENIYFTLVNLTSKPYWYDNREIIKEKFFVRGIRFEKSRKILSRRLDIGDKLNLERDEDNLYDFYAVKIIYKERFLGYVPKEISQKVALSMDIDSSTYDVEVIDIIEEIDYSKIKVAIKEIIN